MLNFLELIPLSNSHIIYKLFHLFSQFMLNYAFIILES